MAFPGLHPLLVIISIVSTVCVTNAQISTPCTTSVMNTFTPCLNYVTGSSARGSSPTQECCNAFKSLMTGSVDCACLIVTGNVPLSIPFVNRNLAISLPRMCRNSVPLKCKASGDPLPAPGPALFGPSPAPADDDAPPGVGGTAAAESPADFDDVAPAASSEPPEAWFDSSQNPGRRPVINTNSSANQSILTLSNLVLLFVGIIAFKL